MKKIFANIVCAFVPSKKYRHKIRTAMCRDRIAELEDKIDTAVQDDFIPAQGVCGNISWIEYMLTNNMPKKVAALRYGLDAKSQLTLDRFFERMTILPGCWWGKYKVRREFVIDSRATTEELLLMKTYEENLDQYRKDYILDETDRMPEVFMEHSGLARAGDAVKNYIAGKDFIDGGAYIGDSALVYIKNYNPRKVYSFELSQKVLPRYLNVMRMNDIPKDKYELVPYGLSDRKGEVVFFDNASVGTSVNNHGDDKGYIIDLDLFVKERHLNVGFIKADIEGAGKDALCGMRETIRRDQPVLSLSIYHTPIEFFEMKPQLEEIVKDLDYKITISKHHPYPDVLAEIVIFAYPKELGMEDASKRKK